MLSQVALKVDQGKIVGFLGINGAGKTTTMDILCGVIGADQGHAKICGVRHCVLPSDATDTIEVLLGKNADKNATDKLLRVALDSRAGIKEFAQKTKSLEELFLHLTK